MKINKKIMLTGIATIVCIAVVALIIGINQSPSIAIDEATSSNSTSSGVDIGEIKETEKETSSPVPSSVATNESKSDIIAPEQSDTNVSVNLTEPNSQPAETTKEHIKGSEAQPSEPPKTSTPAPTNPAPTTPPTSKAPTEPQGGDTNKQGQVYVPGFGYITPGGVQEGISDSDGDIDKAVGNMGE